MSEAPFCPLPPPSLEAMVQSPPWTPGELAKWYAVFTMARHEKQIAWQLGQRQIESFLPIYRTKHRWKNRCTVALELPLFPNYLFVRIDPAERIRVLRVPMVLSIVSSRREPLPVPNHYIKGLQDGLLARGIEPHPGLDVGDRVRITQGAMADMVGVLDRQKNSLRVVLKLEMIGRSVAVEVDAADIESAEPLPPIPYRRCHTENLEACLIAEPLACRLGPLHPFPRFAFTKVDRAARVKP